MIHDAIICLLVLTGSILMLFAAIGLCRLRDALCRAHALAKATTFGICLMLLGMWVALDNEIHGLKLLLVIVFLLLTIPLASHLVCLLSYRQGKIEKNRIKESRPSSPPGT